MYGAIYHNGKGKFTIGGTAVVTSAYHSKDSGTIYLARNSALEITRGTVENTSTGNAIYAPPNASVSINSNSLITVKAPGMAMTNAPTLTDTFLKKAATDVNGIDGVETYDPDNISA